jgi:malonyl CoA-acyl carrier protein transacylase
MANDFALPPPQRFRGLAMSKCPSGSMLALHHCDDNTAEKIAAAASDARNPVVVASFNSPAQLVLAGTHRGIQTAARIANNEYGVRRSSRVPVSSPFHSPLLEPAKSALTEHLEERGLEWDKLDSPLRDERESSVWIPNVTASPLKCATLEEIYALLGQQVTHPVLWRQSLFAAYGLIEEREPGAEEVEFVIPGPGLATASLLRSFNFPTSTRVSVLSTSKDVTTFLREFRS